MVEIDFTGCIISIEGLWQTGQLVNCSKIRLQNEKLNFIQIFKSVEKM